MYYNRIRRSPLRRASGFSLVEVMIVIVIIGLLAGMVAINVRGHLVSAKQNRARADIATIVKALDTFEMTAGRLPTNEEGLDILCRASERLPEPLLKHPPIDPWGRPYQYNRPGAQDAYDVICYGADGKEGGEGENMDITDDSLQQQPVSGGS